MAALAASMMGDYEALARSEAHTGQVNPRDQSLISPAGFGQRGASAVER